MQSEEIEPSTCKRYVLELNQRSGVCNPAPEATRPTYQNDRLSDFVIAFRLSNSLILYTVNILYYSVQVKRFQKVLQIKFLSCQFRVFAIPLLLDTEPLTRAFEFDVALVVYRTLNRMNRRTVRSPVRLNRRPSTGVSSKLLTLGGRLGLWLLNDRRHIRGSLLQ